MASSSETQGVIISIFTFENEKKVAVLNNVIQRVRGDSTFRQIFENVVEKHEKIVSYDRLKVYVSADALKKEDVEVDCEETLSFTAELVTVKFVQFHAITLTKPIEDGKSKTKEINFT